MTFVLWWRLLKQDQVATTSFEKMTKVDHCKFRQTITIYVLTSPESMCSLICNTVKWHMDVSKEGESLWPMAHPAASLPTSLPPSLAHSLPSSPSASVSSDFSQVPSPFSLTFKLPSAHRSLSLSPQTVFPIFEGKQCCWKCDITWKVHVKRRLSGFLMCGTVVFLIGTLFQTETQKNGNSSMKP